MTKRVIGVYNTVPEVLEIVDELRHEGYKREEIFIVANEEVTGQIPNVHSVDHEESNNTESSKDSLWQQIKEAFTLSEPIYNDEEILEDDLMYQYRADLANGAIVIIVEKMI